jgi:DHA1 family bicyclomycin/chloramphenicol resistance-like MFS transporter
MNREPLSLPEFIALFSLITSLTALSIDAMLPALGAIGDALGVADIRNTQLIVSMFILGMAIGELFFGPVSDAIGRKKALMAGLAIYAGGTVIAMTALSLEQIIAGRIVQGIGAAGPKIASRALIRDLYKGDAMARIMSFIFMIFILVPMVAPALGQLVLKAAGWRMLFLIFLGSAAVVAVWLGLRQPETLAPERRIPFSLGPLAANTRLILRHGRVMAATLSAGFIFGAFLLYLSTAQAMFDDLYDAGDRFPLYFAMLAAGIGAASYSNSQLVMRYGMQRLSVAALCGMIVLSGTLFSISIMVGGAPPFAAFMALCFLLFFCFGILFGNLNAMAMESLGRVAGLGASIIASVSSLMAVAFSVMAGRFYDGTALPLAAGFAVAGVVSLTLVLASGKSTAGEV